MTAHADPGSASAGAVRGFTLLEVLAAVAILGLWYVVITHSSVLALHTQGESLRRLAAGAIADARLAELESDLLSGTVPPLGEVEEDEDSFRVKVEVAPFSQGWMPSEATDEAESGAAEESAADLPGLLAAETPGLLTDLYTLRVTVAWLEPDGFRLLTRASFAFDQESYLTKLEEAAAEGRQAEESSSAESTASKSKASKSKASKSKTSTSKASKSRSSMSKTSEPSPEPEEPSE